MSLKHAILGFLRTTPTSGYDLARQFNDSMGGLVWMAQLSQIYPELRRLEEAGLVRGELVRGGKLDSRVYSLTPEGREELERWVRSEIEAPPVRDLQRLQFLLLDSSPPEIIGRHLRRHRDHYEKRCQRLREHLKKFRADDNAKLIARLAVLPKSKHAILIGMRRAALRGDIRRAEIEVEWADATQKLLDRLAAGPKPAGRPVRRRKTG